MKCFRDLKIWNLGKEIVVEIYQLTKDFPSEEKYGLIAQLKRSAISIPSNIAEGFNRLHNKEYRHFLFISLGSCAEVETQLEIALELGYIEETKKDPLLNKINHEARMISSLIKKVSSSSAQATSN
ncbi:MAG: four helix bundle protein [Candidatus Omnitrophica bacterium]|nr:four helix bundle protein [Candidatus Omnitrophota bacterium]MCA9406193.1 four helix bundle protein [Candidatus Omnitrophota bacterium]